MKIIGVLLTFFFVTTLWTDSNDSLTANYPVNEKDKGTCHNGRGTVTDIDGNIYQTMVIGDQEWMVENLKVTHYRNGDPILHLTDNEDWISTNDGAYCYYDNSSSNGEIYGALYNLYAVDDPRGLAPEGYHIPTDEEIMELEMCLGMTYEEAHDDGWRGTNEGSKLAGNADLWTDGALENDPDFGSSGFAFLPGGYRNDGSGYFDYLSNYGYFWSSTEYYSDYAWYRRLSYGNSRVYRQCNLKRHGFSVRCVKNTPPDVVSNIFISPSGAGMSFSWEPVAGAISYKIYRSTVPYADISEMDMVAEITETNWTDPDALSADSYFYRLVTVFPDE